MEPEVVRVLGEVYSAWSADDRERMLSLFHPDAEFHTSGAFPGLDPVYEGHDGVGRFWDAFATMWEELAIVPEHYVVSDGRAAALWHFEGRGRDGLPVRRDGGHVAEAEHGVIVRCRAYGDWRSALSGLRGGDRAGMVIRGYAALNAGDAAVFEELLAEDAEVVPLLDRVEGTAYRGPAGLSAYRDEMLATWRDVHWAPRLVRVEGDRAVCSVRLRGRGRDDLEVEQQVTVAFRFDGEQVVSIRSYGADEGEDEERVPSREDLVGVWRLAEFTSSDGATTTHPAGRDARGLLVYLEDGTMSVHVAAADGHSHALSYCGRWELREDQVLHHVEIDARPQRPGTTVTRRVELSDGELVLTKPPEDGRVEVVRWRR